MCLSLLFYHSVKENLIVCKAIACKVFSRQSVRLCGLGLEYSLRSSAAGGTQDLGHTFSHTDRLPGEYLERNGLAHYQIIFNTVVEN